MKKKTVIVVVAPNEDNCEEKRQLFQRLWSEDNEIELIQGDISSSFLPLSILSTISLLCLLLLGISKTENLI
ncbi:hypothetical protein L1987_12328 [Smallanthus sonchifolius]|uniref:Uncharacterized protein n=1 Tax=Smallanthus sonchifolius TaxID=185202 RepID=A0ACB9JDX2_9ASTR|nr:hypothetical protein L1987_12328 [Smallanthus sonchifolius]